MQEFYQGRDNEIYDESFAPPEMLDRNAIDTNCRVNGNFSLLIFDPRLLFICRRQG